MELINLKKMYNDRIVFENLNYSFKSNNMYWIHGRNGVGKSTFFRILLGAESFTSGQIIPVHKKTLYIPEIELTENWLTIKENINLLFNIAGIKKNKELKFNEKLNITNEDYNTISMDCSMGTNMKVGFSLIFSDHIWDLIIIDEAFSHIDINTQNSIIEQLLTISEEYGTIILFTHHDNIINDFKNKINHLVLKREGIYESSEY